MANNSKKITVIGSCNTDMVIRSERLPRPGETVIGGVFMMNPGGKGANQAVAASRAGGDVTFVTKVGNDLFGEKSAEMYKTEGLNVDYIFTDPANPSGIGMIFVDAKGENCISVASGANGTLGTSEIESARDAIESSYLILMQLEIPAESVAKAARIASEKGVKVVLNPAPAQTLSPELLRFVDIIIPNETEAEILTGIKVTDETSAESAARKLGESGIRTVIVTLGSKGALIKDGDNIVKVDAVPVIPVDTTAAGDTFCGAFCVGLSEGKSVIDSVRFGCKAAAISVTRRGAQASTPYRNEMEE